MKKLALCVLVFAACAHNDASSSSSETTAAAPRVTKESKASQAVRKRASFDLGCEPADLKITEIESENFVRPASFGASCGEKRASYLYRMGTIFKN